MHGEDYFFLLLFLLFSLKPLKHSLENIVHIFLEFLCCVSILVQKTGQSFKKTVQYIVETSF